jgi:hypothetical protein
VLLGVVRAALGVRLCGEAVSAYAYCVGQIDTNSGQLLHVDVISEASLPRRDLDLFQVTLASRSGAGYHDAYLSLILLLREARWAWVRQFMSERLFDEVKERRRCP